MHRSSSRSTAGVNHRYLSSEFVLASFMKGKKYAILPLAAININPVNMEKAEIKICGDMTPLTIVAKDSKAQMNLNKTKFSRETGSEEIDLGNFIDAEDDEKENEEQDELDLTLMPQRSTNSKEISTNKASESYSSSRSNFDTMYNSPTTSKKRQHDSDSSLAGSDQDDDEDGELDRLLRDSYFL
ncbi:unnamed protein product [Didymodactylos carnosus]|uniref:Uncharacterized protein n=1 Tax=Didymodactylos carnosus TaxID=1234261 RepID=A0A816F6F3_9BILA|nr:unnamed protein product [Didymodactylos carnosus]CAF4592333.1 unnamed protein product [Didymodactylos carnosus]